MTGCQVKENRAHQHQEDFHDAVEHAEKTDHAAMAPVPSALRENEDDSTSSFVVKRKIGEEERKEKKKKRKRKETCFVSSFDSR